MAKTATKNQTIQGLTEEDWATIYLQAAKDTPFTMDGKAFNARFEELAKAKKAKNNE